MLYRLDNSIHDDIGNFMNGNKTLQGWNLQIYLNLR